LQQLGGGHQAIAAVVAGAAEHHRRARRPALHDGLRHRKARCLHQGEAGGARLDGEGVGLRHLPHRQ
jgi:hypothetical protein